MVATKSFQHLELVIFLESCKTSKCEALAGCMIFFLFFNLANSNIKQVVDVTFWRSRRICVWRLKLVLQTSRACDILQMCDTSKREALTSCMIFLIFTCHNIKQVRACHFLEKLFPHVNISLAMFPFFIHSHFMITFFFILVLVVWVCAVSDVLLLCQKCSELTLSSTCCHISFFLYVAMS